MGSNPRLTSNQLAIGGGDGSAAPIYTVMSGNQPLLRRFTERERIERIERKREKVELLDIRYIKSVRCSIEGDSIKSVGCGKLGLY